MEKEIDVELVDQESKKQDKPSQTNILILEKAFKIYSTGHKSLFLDFCGQHEIDQKDMDRVMWRHDWLVGKARPFSRENYPLKKKAEEDQGSLGAGNQSIL